MDGMEKDADATSKTSASESSPRVVSGKKCVSFDNMASQLTICNYKTDLSTSERGRVWYTGRDINEFTVDYQKELKLHMYMADQKEKERRKKILSPAGRIKKLFSRGKKLKVPTMA